MPHVLNGVGTWYWGKTNIRTRRGTCEFCGRTTDLRSYDTTKFFVVVWVPLLPLGGKRIFNQCAACRRHRAMSLKRFQQHRDQEVGQAITEYRRSLRDAAKAEVAVAKAVGLEADEQFFALAKEIERALPGNATLQARLGAAYAFFGKPQEAEAAYRRSLRIARDDEVQELLAVLYMREARPDEAAPLVRHVIDQGQREKVGHLYLLAEAYQAAGRHDDALAVLQQLETAFPGIASDAEFSRYRTASLKRRGSAKPVPSTNLTPVTARASQRRPTSVLIAKLIGPAVALTALVIYLGACYSEGHARRVWFVNGLDRAYDVDVNGQRVHLPSGGHTSAALAEGEIAIAAAPDAPPFPRQTCRIETPFFTRPFKHPTFVINPDKAALLYDEQTTYRVASYGSSRQPNPYHLHTGSLVYSFDDMDYQFVDFPSSIEMPKDRDAIQKKRVVQWTQGTPFERILPIQKELGPDALLTFARNYVTANPDDTNFVPRLLFLLPQNEALQRLRSHLEARPVQVEFHRAYQQLIQSAQPEYDVEKEYRERLAKEPDNSALNYLLGRIVAERKKGAQFLEKACQGPTPCAYAYYALAYRAIADGDFQRCLDMSKQAQKLMPDNSEFHAHEMDALLGLKRYEDALALVHEARAKDPLDGGAVLDEIRVLIEKGDPEAARNVEFSYLSSHGGADAEPVQKWKALADGQVAYATGDLEGSARAMASLAGEPGIAFIAAYNAGRLDDAIAALGDDKSTPAETQLVVYIGAMQKEETDLAARHLAAAADAYKQGDRQDRQIAGWLMGANPPDPAVVCAVELMPSQKRVVLTAMALRDPAHRAEYLRGASRFNYIRTFPYWTLKRIADGASIH